jgi:glycopeptide antibiotics resistance protein
VNRKFEYELLAVAMIALLSGLAYYWLTRPSDSAVFLSLLPAFTPWDTPILISRWLGWLPTFAHVFAFSLLTSLVLGRRHILFACLSWGVINALFECGQALPAEIIQRLPDVFNLHTYFSHGVFDPLDLGACVMGAWAAWALIRTGESS